MTEIEELSNSLLQSINRWRSDLEHYESARSTLWYGIMQRCCERVECLLTDCIETLLPVIGDAGLQAAKDVTGGKPRDLMTMGQRVQLLVQIDAELSTSLKQKYPEVHLQRRLLGRGGAQMLHKLSRIRNDFVHGRLEMETGRQATLEFLSCAEELCRSRLIATTAAYQQLVD